MPGGKAYGSNRKYQEECLTALAYRRPVLTPWSGDGIDVLFRLSDSDWTFDIAMREGSEKLVVAECRRKKGRIKQEELAAFAYKIKQLRKSLNIEVAGVFVAKKDHQRGAVKVGHHNGIELVVFDEGQTPRAFTITYLRYNSERDRALRDIICVVGTAYLSLIGGTPDVNVAKVLGPDECQ